MSYFKIKIEICSIFRFFVGNILREVVEEFQCAPVGGFFLSCLQDALPAPVAAEAGLHVDGRAAAGSNLVMELLCGVFAVVPARIALQRGSFPVFYVVPAAGLELCLGVVQQVVDAVHLHHQVAEATKGDAVGDVDVKDLSFRDQVIFPEGDDEDGGAPGAAVDGVGETFRLFFCCLCFYHWIFSFQKNRRSERSPTCRL